LYAPPSRLPREGLCHIISSLEHGALLQASNKIVTPVAERLAGLAAAEPNVKVSFGYRSDSAAQKDTSRLFNHS
jgi:hypothetical protein